MPFKYMKGTNYALIARLLCTCQFQHKAASSLATGWLGVSLSDYLTASVNSGFI